MEIKSPLQYEGYCPNRKKNSNILSDEERHQALSRSRFYDANTRTIYKDYYNLLNEYEVDDDTRLLYLTPTERDNDDEAYRFNGEYLYSDRTNEWISFDQLPRFVPYAMKPDGPFLKPVMVNPVTIEPNTGEVRTEHKKKKEEKIEGRWADHIQRDLEEMGFYDGEDVFANVPSLDKKSYKNMFNNTPAEDTEKVMDELKDDKERVKERWDKIKTDDDNKSYKPSKMKEIRKEEKKKREWNILASIKTGITNVVKALFMEEVEGNYQK